MTKHDWIAVGVDGSDGSRAAARWAAQEARRVGAGLRVVNVFSDYIPMAGFYAAAYPHGSIPGHRLAARTVRNAATDAASILGPDRVEKVVLRGDRRSALLQAAAAADLMVLGDEPHPTQRRLITGSIIGPVAAHSPSPVVVVPADWEAETTRDVVVAGVKSLDGSLDLVRQAFDVAAGRAARLVLLHAWDDNSPYQALMLERDYLEEGEETAAKELRNMVDEVSGEVPGVEVEIRIVHGQPAQQLADASVDADLLAITRRLHGFPFGHLGATGRAVLREVRCPAIVLPPVVEHLPAEHGGHQVIPTRRQAR